MLSKINSLVTPNQGLINRKPTSQNTPRPAPILQLYGALGKMAAFTLIPAELFRNTAKYLEYKPEEVKKSAHVESRYSAYFLAA